MVSTGFLASVSLYRRGARCIAIGSLEFRHLAWPTRSLSLALRRSVTMRFGHLCEGAESRARAQCIAAFFRKPAPDAGQ